MQSQLCNLTILSYRRTRIVVILVAQDKQQSTLFYLWTSPSQGNTAVYHMVAKDCKHTTFWNKNPNQSAIQIKVEQATCRTLTKNRAEWLLEAAGTIQEPYPPLPQQRQQH